MPLVPPLLRNFNIGNFKATKSQTIRRNQIPQLQEILGIDISNYKLPNKRQILRNCVLPELGNYILNCAMNIITSENVEQTKLEL